VSNYDKAYESIRPWLADCDFAKAAKQLGLAAPADGSLTLAVLGRRFCADRNGVTQLDGPAAHINLSSVIIWYLTFGGTGQPTYKFAPLSSFSQGIFGAQSADFSAPAWQEHAGLTLERFQSVCQRIRAEPQGIIRHGERRLLMLFPKVPVLLTYNEPDEEFSAVLDIKFDTAALTFLPFETLAVAHGLIAAEFKP